MSDVKLIVVGSDKGGVGKTTVTRVLCEYFDFCDVSFLVFDTEAPKGHLVRYVRDAEVVDLENVRDQIKIIDSLGSQSKIIIVDVRAGHLTRTLELFNQIGLLDVVKRKEADLVLFHVIGPNRNSIEEIVDVQKYLPDVNYFLVKNFINDSSYFSWDSEGSLGSFSKNYQTIEVPKLNELACEKVDQLSISFSDFAENRSDSKETFSFVLRGYVRSWLTQVWYELERCNILK